MPRGTKTHKRHSRRHRRSARKMIHGGDASTHAIATYGGIGQQHAAAGMGNFIAENAVGVSAQPSMTMAPPPLMTGGYVDMKLDELEQKQELLEEQKEHLEKLKGQEGGTGIITDLAVPAVLLYANQVFGKRRGSVKANTFKKGRRYRRRRSNRRR